MNNEKMIINCVDGTNEVIIREGAAIQELDKKPPIPVGLRGTIGAVAEFIKKRNTEFDHKKAHIIVNREDVSIMLEINETDAYENGCIIGKMQYHPKFLEFGINTGKLWTPTELAMVCKMNRSFFPSEDENRKLVSTLMHFTADVNQKVDRMIQENGNRGDSFTQVVNSNLPASFTMQIPIFKGKQAETLEVETFARIDGRDVKFTLLSPGANETLESIRDAAIDKELDAIREMVDDDIVIIEE